MEKIKDILALELFEVSLLSVLIILICILAAVVIDKILQGVLKTILKRLIASGHREKIDGMLLVALQKPLHVAVLALGSVLGLYIIRTPSWGGAVFGIAFLLVRALTIWCVVWFALRLTNEFTEKMIKKAEQTDTKLDNMLVPVISGLVKFLLVTIGILLVIQNLGYSVSSLVAGLGIGGAALALASKDTLANFFGSLVVFFDHPFVIGDWVSLNGVEGAVEEIRLRTTLIRTFNDSLVMMPNAMFTSASIENWQRRNSRKMTCHFTLVFTTTSEQVEEIISAMKQFLFDTPELYSDSCFIGLAGFGEMGLDIEVHAYTKAKALSTHFEYREKFLLATMAIVEKAGTSFAIPMRNLHAGPSHQATKPTVLQVVNQ